MRQDPSTLNVPNILAVADAIEQHAVGGFGFNMGKTVARNLTGDQDRSGRGCKTVACIAGWTISLFERQVSYFASIHRAAGYFNLKDDAAYALFIPWHGYIDKTFEDFDIDDKQAVRTLRHLAATGEIDFAIGA